MVGVIVGEGDGIAVVGAPVGAGVGDGVGALMHDVGVLYTKPGRHWHVYPGPPGVMMHCVVIVSHPCEPSLHGCPVGAPVGEFVGEFVVGALVGDTVGAFVGAPVGAAVTGVFANALRY